VIVTDSPVRAISARSLLNFALAELARDRPRVKDRISAAKDARLANLPFTTPRRTGSGWRSRCSRRPAYPLPAGSPSTARCVSPRRNACGCASSASPDASCEPPAIRCCAYPKPGPVAPPCPPQTSPETRHCMPESPSAPATPAEASGAADHPHARPSNRSAGQTRSLPGL
jgi:hypothetical protein